MFLFIMVQYTGKTSLSNRFLYLLIFLNINRQLLAFVTFVLGLNLGFSFQHSNKQTTARSEPCLQRIVISISHLYL